MIFEVVCQSDGKSSEEMIAQAYEKRTTQDPYNPRKEIEVMMLDMSKVVTKDKYDESTNYFINRGQAKILREKIEAYKTAMINLVPPEFQENIKLGLETQGDFYNATGENELKSISML